MKRADETEHEAAVRRGDLYDELAQLCREHGADDVAWMLDVVMEDQRSEVAS